jgi:hypothetical protein
LMPLCWQNEARNEARDGSLLPILEQKNRPLFYIPFVAIMSLYQ